MNDHELEKHLRQTLRRCDAAEGFADGVLKRIAVEGREPAPRVPFWRWRSPVLRWAAIPALAAMIAGGVGYRIYERREQQEEAMIAKQQVMLALRITGNKLRLVKQKVKEAEGTKTENKL
jgi:hypothetical protein